VPANGNWSGNDEYAYGARFIAAQQTAGTLHRVTFVSRLVPLAETAGLAFVLYAVGAELAGAVAGALGGVLWLAAPLVLGIGHLDGADIPFALGAALSSWALLRWLRWRDTRRLAWLGLALGAAAGTQVTGLLVVAAALVVVVAAQWRSGVARAVASAALAALIGWARSGRSTWCSIRPWCSSCRCLCPGPISMAPGTFPSMMPAARPPTSRASPIPEAAGGTGRSAW